ncbi:MAG: Dabb family protein, partial [Planctomycetota bacterium]|nr:Dabb family protein [Planctomycetota bacterium]
MHNLKYLFLFLFTVTLITPVATAQTKAKKGVYRHVVLFGFNENVSQQQIKEIEDAFTKLPKQINTIIDFEFGTNVSPENLNDGLT